MRVSEQFIASLLARINIVELISKKITLRQAGTNFIGLCPFHQEKTPSFTVNQNKQFFHCFGCKESGDAIRFFMLIEHKGFLESVEILANQYGLYLEKEPVSRPDPLIEKTHKILDVAADFYHQELFKSNPTAIAALNYLIDRGLNLTTIRHFKLGFSNSGWTNLIDFFQQHAIAQVLELEKNIDIKTTLNQAGLIIEKNHKFYDRFRTRIMFPICNKFGKVVAFGARAINLEQTPKYLNSPETIVFSKQRELYGLDKIKNKLQNFSNLIVVEGYIDVLTLFQAEIYNVVATLGTALNEHHIKTIINIVPEIIFCFDGDLAGYKAAIRAMNFAINMIGAGILKNNHIVRFVSLPKSYDPDSLVKEKGATEFKKIVLEAKVLSDFFFEYLLKKYPDNNIESLHKLAEEAKSQITKLPNNLLQDLWYEKLAGILGIQSDILKPKPSSNKASTIPNHVYNNSNYYNTKESDRSYAKKSRTYKNNNISTNYKHPVSNATKALAMLLLDNNLLSLCNELCSKLDNNTFCTVNLPPDIDLFIKILRILQDLKISKIINDDKQQVSIEQLMSYLEPVYAQRLLLLEPKKIVQFIPFAGMEQEFLGAVKRIDRVLIENTVDELLMISKQRNLEAKEKLLLQQLLQDCSL